MKKILAASLAAALLLLSSCGETPNGASSTRETEKPVSSSPTESYEKPEKSERAGLSAASFTGEKSVTAVMPSFIDSVNSLDSYGCEAVALDENTLALFYTYSVSTMPNYYEPRLAVAVKNVSASDAQVQAYELPGYFHSYAVSNGYVAVESDSENVRVYRLTENFSAENLVKSYKGDNAVLLDFAAENGNLYPLYTDGETVRLGETVLASPYKSVTAGAVSPDGATVALSDGATGAVLDALTQGIVKKDIDLTALDRRVSAFVLADGSTVFLGKLTGGNTSLSAVTVTKAGEVKAESNLFDNFFANPYARGTVFESDSGKLFVVLSHTADTFGFGDAEIYEFAGTLASPLYSLKDGWHPYFAYSFGACFVLTENLSEGVAITDYAHLF